MENSSCVISASSALPILLTEVLEELRTSSIHIINASSVDYMFIRKQFWGLIPNHRAFESDLELALARKYQITDEIKVDFIVEYTDKHIVCLTIEYPAGTMTTPWITIEVVAQTVAEQLPVPTR